ncbi:YceI family protein [Gimibacter soli]|uniref:YceI family protein n=1 Tax=Gimibacter soli TaxID=3024400 RepID=A0AAE9XP06_9PROT|nr:YceI family protein [Gimibacter soli]WCL54563.1 YceI family protein [Gimibacter soli]
MKAFIAVFMLATAPAAASDWQLDREASHLGFAYQQTGAPTEGQFSAFDADISFDPADPAAAKIRVVVDLASIDLGAKDRNKIAADPIWFDSGAHSEAVFTATGATSLGGNRYRADGALAIKGIEKPATLDFTLDIDGDTAHAVGSATLARLDWDLGGGQYASERFIGFSVQVNFDIKAERIAP